jgi:LuxR family maltose regulon positive regulatory protein
MSAPLLATKLFLPPVRPDLVIRPRLLQSLDEALQCKLTLLSAPAGFGKTTLLASWVASRYRRVQAAWFSIDQADNDPARFLEYFVGALQQIDPGLAKAALPLLDLPRPGIEPLLAALINDLAALPAPLVLILDDYHLIEEQAVHQAVDYFLERQPAHFHLVLATRADPPLHLSRLRGRGQLNEMRLADLRFTTEEASAFLIQAMGLSLRPDQVASLASRTEGWIAGLQLAALSLRGQEDPQQFVQTFTGSTRFILDYLTDEVFQAQPTHIQDFLRQTAILERLSGPLCDAVCQVCPGSSQKILDDLEHANLFILPLDDRREWRRYHQLFADLLRIRLEQDQPGLIPGLYQRASAWFENNALPDEAIEYAFFAGEPEHTAYLIAGASQTLLMHGQSATLLRWLERLPPALLDQRPSLIADHAWALLFCSRPMQAIQNCLERLDILLPGLPEDADGEPLATRALPLRAMLALYNGKPDQALQMSLRALDHLDTHEVYLRGVASLIQALSLVTGEETPESLSAIQMAAEAGVKTGNLLVAVSALASLAETEKKLGLLQQTRAHLEQALTIAVDAQGHRLPVAGRSLIGLGDLSREWNDLEQARRLTLEGITLLEQSEMVGAFQGYLTLARIEHANGDFTASQQALRKAWDFAKAFEASDLDDQTVSLLEAKLAILQGKADFAQRWVERRSLMVDSGPSLEIQDPYLARLRKYELVVLARLWLAQSQPERAQPLLDALFTEFERANRPWVMIEIRLLQALTWQALRNAAQAMDHIEQAIALAESQGYIRTFLDEGEGVIALLRQAANRPVDVRPTSTTAYLHRLLTAAGEPATAPLTPRPARPLSIEFLTSREMDVLRLLGGSLSAAEIADELVVSVSTVHSHIKSIYAKLGVHSRYQAVARAKTLKLI